MVDNCDHGNKFSTSMKIGEFLASWTAVMVAPQKGPYSIELYIVGFRYQ
jgi:hypothetical protein